MGRPRLLDLFCGAGGASMGYHRAGFDVVGVDIKPQPHYPFEFIQADALTFPLDGFDAIHASPPCQVFSAMKVMWNQREHHDLLTPTRERLTEWGGPWAIENVSGAPMDTEQAGFFKSTNGVVLCGSMFGLETDEYRLQRHRLFESNVPLSRASCRHSAKTVVGFYGSTGAQIRRRVNGHKDRGSFIRGEALQALIDQLMGTGWMNHDEATQAIPPAYTEHIGRQLLAAIEVAA